MMQAQEQTQKENIPKFKSDLKKFKKYPEAFESLCSQMTTSLGFACSDDIRILCKDGLDYIATTQPNNDLMPNIPSHSSKLTYCGSLRVTANQLCLFMYHNYTVNYKNLMDGLLCLDLIKMDWRKNNGKVHKKMFYYTIINLFKKKNMKYWSNGVLQEWNKEMFQKKKTYKTHSVSLLALYEQSQQ
ncbi:hypothetical protein BGW80DRAFT_1253036 [Lactifluus volemus]|nr:hypothetical protein BGW80DRAFT_1253036 [Lactifluus volemus]